MRIILVYDINQERVFKIMKTCREYLHHVQNSVFEGDISDKNLRILKEKLEYIIEDSDSILVYSFRKELYKKEIIGFEKQNISNII